MSEILQTELFDTLIVYILTVDVPNKTIEFELPPNFRISEDALNKFTKWWHWEDILQTGRPNYFGMARRGEVVSHMLKVQFVDLAVFEYLRSKTAELLCNKGVEVVNPRLKIIFSI